MFENKKAAEILGMVGISKITQNQKEYIDLTVKKICRWMIFLNYSYTINTSDWILKTISDVAEKSSKQLSYLRGAVIK